MYRQKHFQCDSLWNPEIERSRPISLTDKSESGSNMASAMLTSPGFWLLRTEKMVASSYPALMQKWSSPRGNTNTSPSLRTFWNSWFLVSTNPAITRPLLTKNISEALGWEWGITKPSSSRSVLANERPSVFRPGKSEAVTMVRDER